MFAGRDSNHPDQWETQEVLKWMQENDDSRGDIKSRVMSVVRANDLDGHTLKQLLAEKDEIQDLFPALKERLAFKSMLRKLFKEDGPHLQPDPTIIPKPSPPAPPEQRPERSQVSSSHSLDFATSSSQRPNFGPASPVQFSRKDNPASQTAQPSEYRTAQIMTHRPVERRLTSLLNSGVNTTLQLQKLKDLTTINSVPSNAFGTEQSVTPHSSKPVITSMPVYISQPTIGCPPQAKRHASQNISPTPVSITPAVNVTQPVIPFVTQSAPLVKFVPSPHFAGSPPQISSVTSYATADKTVPNPRPVCLTSSNNAPTNPTPKNSSPRTRSAGFLRYIDYPAPLPTFADDLEEALKCSDTIRSSVRRRVMREAALFYVGITRGQRLNSNDYVNIGRTMMEKYPALGCGGSIPWALFNKNLSQSIRNLRRRLKQRSDTSLWDVGMGTGPLPLSDDVTFDLGEVSDDDDDDAVEEVMEEEEGDEEGEVFLIKEEVSG